MKRDDKIKIGDLAGKYSRNGGYKISIADLIARDHERLLCNNPQCRLPITAKTVAFSQTYNEVYHDEDCANTAMALKEVQGFRAGGGRIVSWDVVYITREEALSIKSGLEKKTK